MVERVEIYQGVQLTQEVADRDPGRAVALGIEHHEINQPCVLDLLFDQKAQDGAVDTVEEFPNVQFQCVAVRVAFPQGVLGVVAGTVRAHTDSAGEGLVDECGIKERVNHPIDGMLHNDVTECRSVDDSFLGFENLEGEVWPWPILAGMDLLVECFQVAAEACLEIEAGTLLPLALAGVEEGLVQVLPGKYAVKKVSVSFQKCHPDVRFPLPKSPAG